MNTKSAKALIEELGAMMTDNNIDNLDPSWSIPFFIEIEKLREMISNIEEGNEYE